MRLQHFSLGRQGHNPRTPKLILSAALALGLTATALPFTATTAKAANIRLGNVDVQIDTTVSAGVSMRMDERDTRLLPEVNGGPADDKRKVNFGPNPVGNNASFAAICGLNGTLCIAETATKENSNYDASINTDDGRLNFNDGDLTAATFKVTSEFEAFLSDNVTAFARVNAFYDAVNDDEGAFERAGLNDRADSEAVSHLDLLDAYVSYDTQLAGNPLLLRIGKQVINWGEATFVLGGNSVFSPINVAAIRRPGAEIKEALLPVEAIYASYAINQDISVEAYVGGWDEFQIDNGGTAFANSDAFNPGSSAQGNGSFIGGRPNSGAGRVNCDFARDDSGTPGAGAISATGQLIAAFAINALEEDSGSTCANSAIDFRYKLGSDKNRRGGGIPEAERRAYNDPYFLPRGSNPDLDQEDFDDVGLALRWYSAALNSTEFALYYQKVNSRIPYASIASLGPSFGWTTVGQTTDGTNRAVGVMGCVVPNGGDAAAVPGQPRYNAKFNDFKIDDPFEIFDSNLSSALQTAAGGQYNSEAGSLARAQEMVCASWAGVHGGGGTTTAQGQILAHTGEQVLAIGFPMEVVAEFPEVETIGFSFNTTVAGWGVQGEIAYRDEMPLQIDTDAATIAGVVSGCGFLNYGVGGDAVINALFGAEVPISSFFTGLSTYNQEYGLNCTNGYHLNSGHTAEEVYNWDIGTTATFTRSNPVVNFLGADLGILLTEFAGVHAPDYEDHGFIGPNDKLRAANLCTSGSDLPLRGLFNLDERDPSECRPTASAWGGVLLAQLQYNNAFGSPWSLRPTLFYTVGIEGMALRPAGSWVEDQGRVGLSLSAEYQSKWTASLSFTDYQGDALYNRDIDRDTLSASVSYAF